MKRDMDLVRDLMLKIAEADNATALGKLVCGRDTGDQNYEIAAYHLQMLIEEAGLVRGIKAHSNSGKEWIQLQLTWQGQDFLESVRDATVWESTKEGANKLGGASFDLFLSLAKAYLRAEAKKRLNIDL
jgi:hypothetical protein